MYNVVNMNNMIDKDFMRDEYTKDDICNARKNPYPSKFTAVDELRIFLEAFIKENNWTKEEAKEKVDAILA